jgi:hypothetical protein
VPDHLGKAVFARYEESDLNLSQVLLGLRFQDVTGHGFGRQ